MIAIPTNAFSRVSFVQKPRGYARSFPSFGRPLRGAVGMCCVENCPTMPEDATVASSGCEGIKHES
jgi:hypothetical protein